MGWTDIVFCRSQNSELKMNSQRKMIKYMLCTPNIRSKAIKSQIIIGQSRLNLYNEFMIPKHKLLTIYQFEISRNGIVHKLYPAGRGSLCVLGMKRN